MNAWIILLAVVTLGTIFVLLPVVGATFARYRRPRAVRCPMTGAGASVQVDALRASLSELAGRRVLRIRGCSRWPRAWGCRQQCLAAAGVDPRAEPRARAKWSGVRTILVPLDGTAENAAVLPAVAALARDQRAVVRLMRTAAMPPAVESGQRIFVYADQEADRIEAETRDYLNALGERMPGVRVTTAVRFGEPVAEVVAEAEGSGVDVIAMATHEDGWSRRNRLASAVANATRIPVVRVPCAPHGLRGVVGDRRAPLAPAGL